MNRKDTVAESLPDEVPDFDPADFIYGDPTRFTADTVTIAARVYLQRHEIDTAHPMDHALQLASAWLTVNA